MRLKPEIKKVDSELLFKNSKLKYGETEVFTPIKASYRSNPISKVNEIYKEYTLEKIDRCDKNDDEERKANAEINRQKTTGINFVIINYTSPTRPNNKQIEFLSDIQCSNSDVAITPIWSEITKSYEGEKLRDTFLSLTNEFVEVTKTQNGQTIWGMLPTKIPRLFLEPLVENYVNQDITSFVVDFGGRSIDGVMSRLRYLTRLISANGLTDECILYGINASEGKFMKKAAEIPAKDFMSLGFGMDILGLNHTPIRMSKARWDEIKAERQESTYRIFDRENYSYRRTSGKEARILQVYSSSHRKDYNTKQQYAETLALQKQLEATDSIKSYIDEKEQASLYIDKMAKIRKEFKD